MKRRFTINDSGELVDRDGTVLGRVVGITLDVPNEGALVGGKGGSSSSLLNDKEKEGGVGETNPQLIDEAADVWKHYLEVYPQTRSKDLDAETRKIINAALKVATVDECNRAIDGNKGSAFHQGQNARRKRYTRISHILRGKRSIRTTREQIDLFLDLAEKSGSVAAPDDARVSAARRAVLDAIEFPGDEQASQRGDEAEAWLIQNGWKIVDDGNHVEFLRVGV